MAIRYPLGTKRPRRRGLRSLIKGPAFQVIAAFLVMILLLLCLAFCDVALAERAIICQLRKPTLNEHAGNLALQGLSCTKHAIPQNPPGERGVVKWSSRCLMSSIASLLGGTTPGSGDLCLGQLMLNSQVQGGSARWWIIGDGAISSAIEWESQIWRYRISSLLRDAA